MLAENVRSVHLHWTLVVSQRSWRWCNRCQGLFFGGNGTSGVCPAGGGHDPTYSWQYLMAFTALG